MYPVISTALLLLWAAVAPVAHAMPNAVVESDCAAILTEEKILASQIVESSEDLQRLFAHDEAQTRNWLEFLSGKVRVGGRVIVLHQTQIKRLNEEILHLTGTETYLEAFHDLLHQYLAAHPHFGRVLHNDYKNHFVETDLDQETFNVLVVRPVLDRLATHMNRLLPEWNWAEWIPQSLFIGSGSTPAEAYFSAGIARAGASRFAINTTVAEWRTDALKRREIIKKAIEEKGIPWDAALAMIHHYVARNPEKLPVLERWLRVKGLGQIYQLMVEYNDDLQIADFQPLAEPKQAPTSLEDFVAAKANDPVLGPRANWIVERRALFMNAREAHYIVVTDIQQLGSVARKFQDEWIANGAKLEDLPKVYALSTEAIEVAFARTFHELKKLLGENAKIHVYRSGDDGVWLLPEMSQQQREGVRELFASLRETGSEYQRLTLKFHHSDLIAVPDMAKMEDAFASALKEARVSLFEGKKKK